MKPYSLNKLLDAVIKKDYKITDKIYGGMMNALYLIKDIDNKKYIAYVPVGNSNALVNRAYEKENTDIVEALGITSKLVYFDLVRGIKIKEYIEGKPLNEISNIDYQKVADLLHILHSSKKISSFNYQPFTKLLKFENEVVSFTKLNPIYNKLRNTLTSNRNILLNNNLVLCHNDAQKSNIIVDKNNNYKLIDFEFMGNNDPIYDIATFANNNIQDGEKLMHYYFINLDSNKWKRFYLWRIFISLQWYLLALIKDYQKQGTLSNFDFKKVADSFLNLATISYNKFVTIR